MQAPEFIDTHCHLDDPRFDADRDAVYQRADAAGVRQIIVPAISRRYWPRLRQITQDIAQAWPAYGLHPMFMAEHDTRDLEALASWLGHEQAIAIGECGLDYYSGRDTRRQQLELFDAQLSIAHQHQLPVIVHARKAVEDAIEQIRHYPGLRGVFHSYSGSYQQAKKLVDLGFMFGIGGPYTWENARKLHALLPMLPLDCLLLETDAPDQPDAGHRGQRNEPAFIVDIATAIAARLKIDIDTLAEQTNRNAASLFPALAAERQSSH